MRCCILFYGLPRSFEKCSKNIKSNIIDYNPDTTFDIYVCTDSSNKQTEKWGNKTVYELNKDLFESKLKTLYTNVKGIYYLNGPVYENVKGVNYNKTPFIRLKKLLETVNTTIYDYFIFSRMDVIIHQPIYMNDLNNKFAMATSYSIGGGLFYNRDWDYMWIGAREPFLLFCSKFLENNKIFFPNFPSDELQFYKKLPQETFEYVKTKYNLVPHFEPSNEIQHYMYNYVHLFYKLILLLESNNYTFDLQSYKSTVVRY